MKKVLAVLGIAAMFTTAAFADTAVTPYTIDNVDDAVVTMDIDAYSNLTFLNNVTDPLDEAYGFGMHVHLSPDDDGQATVGGNTTSFGLYAIANYDYTVTLQLTEPTKGGVKVGTWSLVAAGDDTANDDLVEVYTPDFGDEIRQDVLVNVTGITLAAEYGEYTGAVSVTLTPGH